MYALQEKRRAALLQAAARLIESRQPAKAATLRFQLNESPNGPALFLVRFDFPGVVSVHAHDMGALIVRSKPGLPAEPDTLPPGPWSARPAQ